MRNSERSAQGAFDTVAHCYYAFGSNDGSDPTVLYRINLEGRVEALTNSEYRLLFNGLLYSRFDGRLYAFRRNAGASGVAVCQILTYPDRFEAKELVKDIWGVAANTVISSAVDNNTGKLYFRLGTDSTFEIYSFQPGDSAAKKLLSQKKSRIFGLCFNPADERLYAIRQDSTKTRFVKIDNQGNTTVIDTLPFRPDPASFCAAIDRCANQYMLMGKVSNTHGYLVRLAMNGSIMGRDTTDGILQAVTAAR